MVKELKAMPPDVHLGQRLWSHEVQPSEGAVASACCRSMSPPSPDEVHIAVGASRGMWLFQHGNRSLELNLQTLLQNSGSRTENPGAMTVSSAACTNSSRTSGA